MSSLPCMICQRSVSKPCPYCLNIRLCTRCYQITHRHNQTHRHNVMKKEGSYTEPLPEPT